MPARRRGRQAGARLRLQQRMQRRVRPCQTCHGCSATTLASKKAGAVGPRACGGCAGASGQGGPASGDVLGQQEAATGPSQERLGRSRARQCCVAARPVPWPATRQCLESKTRAHTPACRDTLLGRLSGPAAPSNTRVNAACAGSPPESKKTHRHCHRAHTSAAEFDQSTTHPGRPISLQQTKGTTHRAQQLPKLVQSKSREARHVEPWSQSNNPPHTNQHSNTTLDRCRPVRRRPRSTWTAAAAAGASADHARARAHLAAGCGTQLHLSILPVLAGQQGR